MALYIQCINKKIAENNSENPLQFLVYYSKNDFLVTLYQSPSYTVIKDLNTLRVNIQNANDVRLKQPHISIEVFLNQTKTTRQEHLRHIFYQSPIWQLISKLKLQSLPNNEVVAVKQSYQANIHFKTAILGNNYSFFVVAPQLLADDCICS